MTQTSAELAVEGWFIAQAAREVTDSIDPEQEHWFGIAEDGRLRPLGASDKGAVLQWLPSVGWRPLLADNDPRRDLLDLYLPVSSAIASRPIIVGHLGQSLDGFIATNTGDACFVTGPQNILHLHRLRALCDAVVVGARTVENDNPRLTTRLVSGTNPVRVVLDPHNRLASTHHIFRDGDAKTLRVIGRDIGHGDGCLPMSNVLEVGYTTQFDLHELVDQLRARGFFRIFIEGGGVTVSSFLEAGLLDRLHIAVAPLLIGDGRPAIRMAPRRLLKDCMKVKPRIYRTGEDVLFDCDLRANGVASCEGTTALEATRLT